MIQNCYAVFIQIEKNLHVVCIFWICRKRKDQSFFKITEKQPKYAVILNLSPDHIERHGTLDNYIKSKFKLLKNQTNGCLAFLKKK